MATYQILRTGSVAPTYTISDGVYSRVVFLNGAGLPPIRRELTGHPYFGGSVDNGYHFSPREMTLRLFFNVASKAAADLRRDELYNIFQPAAGTNTMILRVTRNDGKIRQIDCHTIGIMDMPESTRVGYDQAFDVRLLAPNPIWYEPSILTLTATPTGTNQNFNFPNLGDWETWPTVKVFGAVTGFKMTNILSLPGGGTRSYIVGTFDVAAGDIVTFETHPAKKTLTTSASASLINKISFIDFLGFIDFKLFGVPEANPNNLINLVNVTRDANHKVQIIYQARYLGL